MPRKQIQYDSLVSGISNAQALERVSYDKFQPQVTPPQSNWKKIAAYSVAAIMPFVCFVAPTVSTNNWTEKVSYDRFAPQRPDKVYDLKRNQYLYPSMMPIDEKQLTVKEAVSVDRWQGQKPDIIYRLPNPQYKYPSFVTGKLPAIQSLQDNFDFGGLDSGKWSNYGGSQVNATTNLLLELTSSLGGNYVGILSLTQFDLKGSSAYSQLVDAGNQSITSLEVYPIQLSNGSNAVSVMVAQNVVHARKKIGGTSTDVGSTVAYNSSTMKWFRIRESGGTTFWEYAADPTGSWTQIASTANPIDVTALNGEILIGTWQAESSTTTAKVDNFNVTPTQYQFNWQGYTWNQRIHAGDPSTNQYWSPNNTSVDGNNYLNLQLSNPSGNAPLGTEIFSAKRGFGYGTYIAVIGTELDTMDHKVGFGSLFTFDFTAPPDYKEIDSSETRDYNSQPNIQILYNHAWNNGGGRSFTTNNQDVNAAAVQTHRIIWTPGQIVFDSFIGAGTGGANYFHAVQTDNIPAPGLERVHFNIWNDTGLANYASATPINVVVQSFSFTPLGEESHLTLSVPNKIYDISRKQYLYPSSFLYPLTPETITVDKWIGNKPDIFLDLKRQQYLYPNSFFDNVFPSIVSVISQQSVHISYPTTTQYQSRAFVPLTAEIITVDKWHPEIQRPPKDLARNQYLYPTFFPGFVPIVPVFAVQQDTNVIIYTERTQYQSKAFVPLVPEKITIDKWLGQKPEIIYNLPRITEYPSLAFVNVFPSIAPVFSAQDVVMVNTRMIQYQTKAFVQLVPEVITVDKWTGYHPDKIWDLNRLQYTYPTFSPVDPKQLTLHEAINSDKWTPQKPDKLFDLKRLQYLFPSFTFHPIPLGSPAIVMPDKWQPEIQRPPKDLVRNQYLYEYQFFANQFPTIVPVFSQEAIRIDYPTLTQYQSRSFVPFINEIITPDKWLGTYPNLIFDIKRNPHLYVPYANFVAIPPQLVIIQNDNQVISFPHVTQYPGYMSPILGSWLPSSFYWKPQVPDKIFDLKRLQYAYPFYSAGLSQVNETVSLDRFAGYHPDKIWDLKRQQYTYPYYVAGLSQVKETVSIDRFIGNHPDIIFSLKRQQFTYPSYFAELTYVNLPTVDRWIGQKPDIIFDLKRQQFTYPYFFIDAKQLSQPERVSIDKFMGYHPDFVLDVKRQQFVYPTYFAGSNRLEAITMDKWLGYEPSIIWDIRRLQYMYPSLFLDQRKIKKNIHSEESRGQGSIYGGRLVIRNGQLWIGI